MKKYLYTLAIAAMTMAMTSCDGKQEEPVIQWYPVVTLEGESVYYLEINQDWTLPGYSAVNTLTGEDATDNVDVSIYDVIADDYVDEIDLSSPGMYIVYYDSYGSIVETVPSVSVTRNIYVYDPDVTLSIEGDWAVNYQESIYLAGTLKGYTYEEAADYYIDQNGATVDYISKSYEVTFTQIVPGIFEASDLFGGWYQAVRGYDAYGPYYMMTGYVGLNNDGDLTLLSSYVDAWGDSLDSLSDGTYDTATGTISYDVSYADGAVAMHVVLNYSE